MKKKAVILIGQGFDEEEMIYFLYKLRRMGKAVCLVSPSAGLVTGAYGLTVRPDYSLDQFDHEAGSLLVMVPGGAKSVITLLADPRVHRLFQLAKEHDGRVAVTSAAAAEFTRAGFNSLLHTPKFLKDRNGAGKDLIQQIINLIEQV